MVKVKNLNGTTGRVPNGYNSWLHYWESKTGLVAKSCNRFGCGMNDSSKLVGAHVKKADSLDNSWYIVPLCQADNMRSDVFYVFGPLVPVNC